jgi:hypothetical protein
MTAKTSMLTLVLLLGSLTGCSETHTQNAEPRPVEELSAGLISPTDIVLEWRARDPDAAGRVLEFATERQGPYTPLEFLPPRKTSFTHPDLLPNTPFYYRLRAFYGPASEPIKVTLPKGSFNEKAQRSDHDWTAPTTAPGRPTATASIAEGAAAPTGLSAVIMHANGIRFQWTDRATDEEGQLLEVKSAGSSEFKVVAVLDPDVNSFGLVTLPDEKQAWYRVRAFTYGPLSEVAHQKTRSDRFADEPSPAVSTETPGSPH